MGSCVSKLCTSGPENDEESLCTVKGSNSQIDGSSNPHAATRKGSRTGLEVSEETTSSANGAKVSNTPEMTQSSFNNGNVSQGGSLSPVPNGSTNAIGMVAIDGESPLSDGGSRGFNRSGTVTSSAANLTNDSRVAVASTPSRQALSSYSSNGDLSTAGSRSGKDEIKILLLGSGESGKSTILKQMKIIHLGGYSQEERMSHRTVIYQNVIDCAQGVVSALEKLGVTFEGKEGFLHYDPRKRSDETGEPCEDSPDSPSSLSQRASMSDSAESDGAYTNIGSDSSRRVSKRVSGSNLASVELDHYQNLRPEHQAYASAPNPATKSHTLSESEGPTNKTANSNPWPIFKSDFEYIKNAKVCGDPEAAFDVELAVIIENLWNHSVVRSLVSEGRLDLYVMDSAPYFFANVRRISHPEYIPSVNDILRARIKTSGTHSIKFNMSGFNVNMIDVGGQRSERKKWIQYFQNVTVVIFCVALSEYDQVLREEENQNRMIESLSLFESIVNSPWFADTSVVLFLNKIDVFTEKLPHSPLENIFPDYTGGNDVNKAVKYILWRFTQINTKKLNLYPHLTQATDTTNIRLVFAAIKETVLQKALKESGIV